MTSAIPVVDPAAGEAGYLAEYGVPSQVTAWRGGTPYVAELAEDSAGR